MRKKRCSKCNLLKSREAFSLYHSSKFPGVLRNKCKECCKEEKRSWYEKNKKEVREYNLEYRSNPAHKEEKRAKDLAYYYKRKNDPETGHQYVEKRNKYAREIMNPKRIEYRREHAREAFLKCLDAYGGRKCNCCGETCITMLSIDHITEGQADRSVYLHYWLVKNGYPSGFQVLCNNCNLSKYKCGGTCEHKLIERATTISKESRPQVINGGRSASGPTRGHDIVSSVQ